MSRQKFSIEYSFRNTPLNLLWNSISSPSELSEWFADNVSEQDGVYTFSWNNHVQSAILLKKNLSKRIRLQWEEDEGTSYYFEMQITQMELSSDVSLIVTDFADVDEKDDSVLLWNQQVDQLRRRVGA